MSLALIVLLAQATAKEPPRAKPAFEAARVRAAKWDPEAFCYNFGMQPKSDAVYETGRSASWNFMFATRRGAAPGRLKTANVEVWFVTQQSPAKEVVHGLGVGLWEREEIEPPLPVGLEEGWLDSDKAFAAFRKQGLGQTAFGMKLLEVRVLHGRTVWRGVGASDVILLDANGRAIARGENPDVAPFLAGARPTTLSDAAGRVAKDWAWWRDAGPIRIVSIDAQALEASGFLNGARVQSVAFEAVVERPERRRLRVRILNERIEWVSSDPKVEAAQALPVDKLGLLKEALPAHEGLKAWVSKNPKASVRIQSEKDAKLLLTFRAEEEKIVRFDPATGKLE